MRVIMSLAKSPVSYLTAGKQYKVYPFANEAYENLARINDDTREKRVIRLETCAHLKNAPWIVVPTEHGVKKEHELEVRSGCFQEIWDGLRAFEIRRNYNRNFLPGDLVLLNEYSKKERVFTGRQLVKRISCVAALGQKSGYVVLGLMDCEEYGRRNREQSKNLFHN